jgi:hypothetical protein
MSKLSCHVQKSDHTTIITSKFHHQKFICTIQSTSKHNFPIPNRSLLGQTPLGFHFTIETRNLGFRKRKKKISLFVWFRKKRKKKEGWSNGKDNELKGHVII